MKKILITDPVDNKCRDILVQDGFDVDFITGLSLDELKSIIGKYNALIVRSETKVDVSLISLMDSMEVIGRAGAGVDNIDLTAATHKGILVMNTPGGNTISAAEHTMALMLSTCRNIPQAYLSMKEKKWERKKFTGSELSGKTLLIIGLGKIGREVALRSISFGMKILAYDPVISTSNLSNLGDIKLVSLEEGLIEADIISVHVPLTDETKNIINSSNIYSCKKGVRFINCARGGIINEEAVIEAIDKGHVLSAAFDVYENEPPDFSNKLFSHPAIICTPHLGASTEEAQEKVAVQIAGQVSGYFKENNFSGSVNIPFRNIEKRLWRYLDLSEKIGYLQSRFINSAVKEVKVNLTGDFLHSNSTIITAAVLKGFLKDRWTENVNFINAPVLMKESGIPVSEIKITDNGDINNLIYVVFVTERGIRTIAGTVFGEQQSRIIKIDNFLVEFNPEGEYIIYYNTDKPGVLAAVSKYLAEAGYNISGVFLGRDIPAGKAISILGIDSKISDDVVKIISGTNGVLDVYPVRFTGER